MKKHRLLTYTLAFLGVLAIVSIFSTEVIAFAEGLVAGGGEVSTAIPVPDGYFWAILIFFVLDIIAMVFLVKNIIVYMKLTKTNKMLSVIPYAIATAFSLKTIEIFLAMEIILLLALYLTNRRLSAAIKNRRSQS